MHPGDEVLAHCPVPAIQLHGVTGLDQMPGDPLRPRLIPPGVTDKEIHTRHALSAGHRNSMPQPVKTRCIFTAVPSSAARSANWPKRGWWLSPLDVFRHAGSSSPSRIDRQFPYADPRGLDGDDCAAVQCFADEVEDGEDDLRALSRPASGPAEQDHTGLGGTAES